MDQIKERVKMVLWLAAAACVAAVIKAAFF